MNKVIFSGWKPGFNKVSMTQLLRDHAGGSLSKAKSMLDAILDNRTVIIDIQSGETAHYIFCEASKLGVMAEKTISDKSEK